MRLSLPGFGSRGLFGLDIGSSSVKVVQVSPKGRSGGFELTHLGPSGSAKTPPACTTGSPTAYAINSTGQVLTRRNTSVVLYEGNQATELPSPLGAANDSGLAWGPNGEIFHFGPAKVARLR